jgi:hypothetical protein
VQFVLGNLPVTLAVNLGSEYDEKDRLAARGFSESEPVYFCAVAFAATHFTSKRVKIGENATCTWYDK